MFLTIRNMQSFNLLSGVIQFEQLCKLMTLAVAVGAHVDTFRCQCRLNMKLEIFCNLLKFGYSIKNCFSQKKSTSYLKRKSMTCQRLNLARPWSKSTLTLRLREKSFFRDFHRSETRQSNLFLFHRVWGVFVLHCAFLLSRSLPSREHSPVPCKAQLADEEKRSQLVVQFSFI